MALPTAMVAASSETPPVAASATSKRASSSARATTCCATRLMRLGSSNFPTRTSASTPCTVSTDVAYVRAARCPGDSSREAPVAANRAFPAVTPGSSPLVTRGTSDRSRCTSASSFARLDIAARSMVRASVSSVTSHVASRSRSSTASACVSREPLRIWRFTKMASPRNESATVSLAAPAQYSAIAAAAAAVSDVTASLVTSAWN